MPTYDQATQDEGIAAWASIYEGGEIRILSGATVLVTVQIPDPAFGAATSGAVDLSSNLTGTNAESGTADSYEADTAAGATTTGTVGAPGSGEDMEISADGSGGDLDLVANGTTTITSFQQTFGA